jgi:membrane protease YdiL (CAAX protease family)
MNESEQNISIAEAPRREYPFWEYKDLILFFGVSLPSLVMAALLVRGARAVLPALPASKALDVLLVQFLGYAFLFVALYLLLRIRYDRPFWSSLAWEGSSKAIGVAFFGGPVVAIVVAAVGLLLDPPKVNVPMEELLRDRLSIALVGLFATTLGPVCEELAFRGFLQPLLTRTFGAVVGVVLAALPFTLLHGPQYGWSWQHVLPVGLAGLSFGIVRYVTGSTAAATAMHATYNLTVFSAAVLQRGSSFRPW